MTDCLISVGCKWVKDESTADVGKQVSDDFVMRCFGSLQKMYVGF